MSDSFHSNNTRGRGRGNRGRGRSRGGGSGGSGDGGHSSGHQQTQSSWHYNDRSRSDAVENWRRPASQETKLGSSSASSSADSSRFSNVSLVSRSSGLDMMHDANSLKNFNFQEEFFEYIGQRSKTVLEQSGASKVEQGSLDPILAALRKLREGIIASGRMDLFAIEVFEFSAELCLRADNFAELLKSLVGLVLTFYPQVILTNDHAKCPRRLQMTNLYLLYLICYLGAHSKSTQGSSTFQGNSREVLRVLSTLPGEIQTHPLIQDTLQLGVALRINVDFNTFGRVWRKSDELSQCIIKHTLPLVRDRTWAILSKSYHRYPETDLRALVLMDVAHNDEWQEYLKSSMLRVIKGLTAEGYEERVANGAVFFKLRK